MQLHATVTNPLISIYIMLQFLVIGNLGADAEVKEANGRKFVSFNVAHTDVWTDDAGTKHENTMWVSCALNGDGGNLLPYLKRGACVFVQGRGSVRVYSSPTQRAMVGGLNISVDKVELVGGRVDDVPRELIAEGGALLRTYKAYYLDPQEYAKVPKNADLGCMMVDRRGQQYQISPEGWISKLITPNDEHNETT